MKLVFFWIWILAGAVSAGDSLAADSQAIRYYEDAITRFNNGDSKGALIQLRNALQRDPTQLSARVLMGRIQLDLGNPLQAEEALELARKLGVDPSLVAVPLARARNQAGKHQQVIEELIPTAYPANLQADLWVELAKARFGVDDRHGAEAALESAFRLAPYHEEGMLTRVRDLFANQAFDQALPLVGELISRYPNKAEAWFMMGSMYHAQGELESALAHYRQAARLDPGLHEASLGEALALLDGGNGEPAVEVLQELTDRRPGFLKAHYFLVRALRSLGRKNEVAAALDRAAGLIKSIPVERLEADTRTMLLSAMITYENGEYETAFQLLSRYLELEPGDLSAQKVFARLLARLDKPVDAQRLLTRLRANHPEDRELLILLGDANGQLHDHQAAERYYRMAMDLGSASPALIERVGLAQLRQGEVSGAIGTFEWVVNQAPGEVSGFSLFLGALYLSEGRLDQARVLADRLVEHDPESLAARNLLAAVAARQGEHSTSRQLLEQLLREAPDYRPARINLIKLDVIERRFESADAALRRLLEVDPEDEIVLHESARLALAQGDRATAVNHLERIRELHPAAVGPITELMSLYLGEDRAVDALKVGLALDKVVRNDLRVKTALAQVELMRGENAVAASLLTDASRLAGYDVKELREIAQIQARMGELGDAEANLRKALTANPSSVAARLDLASLLARQERLEDAAGEVLLALESEPDDPVALTLLGDVRNAQGQAAAALSLYQRALAGAPDSPQLILRIHAMLLHMRKPTEALQVLQEWNQKHPDTPSTLLVQADHLQQAGDTGEALALYLRLAQLAPDNPVVHNNLANMLVPVDAERALAAALRAHELAPNNASVLDTLGWMLVQLGDLERGLAYLREAVARNSQSPAIRYHLGVALEEYGSLGEAQREIRAALSMGREFEGRKDAEVRLLRLETRVQ